MASRMSKADQERLNRQGIGMIAPEEGMQIFDKVFRMGGALAVLPINWTNFVAAQAHISPRFTDLAQHALQPTSGLPSASPSAQDIIRRLTEAPMNKRKPLLQAHLSEHAMHVLGLNPSYELDFAQPLRDIGMDSLMAVELRNAISSSLQRKLPSTLLFDYPTIDALTGFLTQEIWPALPPDAGSAPTTQKPASPDEAGSNAAEIQNLSDDEAEALLLAELEKPKRK